MDQKNQSKILGSYGKHRQSPRNSRDPIKSSPKWNPGNQSEASAPIIIFLSGTKIEESRLYVGTIGESFNFTLNNLSRIRTLPSKIRVNTYLKK